MQKAKVLGITPPPPPPPPKSFITNSDNEFLKQFTVYIVIYIFYSNTKIIKEVTGYILRVKLTFLPSPMIELQNGTLKKCVEVRTVSVTRGLLTLR